MAVYDGDVDRVRALLQQGADPNHPVYWTEAWRDRKLQGGSARNPPLRTACWLGMLEIAKLLVQHGADIDRGSGRSNATPLHLACFKGHKEVVDYLIREAGCKVGELISVTLN